MTHGQTVDEQRLTQEMELGLQGIEKARHDALQASFNALRAQTEYLLTAQQLRPCFMTPIRVEHDGFQWLCKAQNIEGVVGGGDCPQSAMLDFDKVWNGLDRKRPDSDSSLEAGQ